MALPTVDDLHHSLMRFAETTHDIVCANRKLEKLLEFHPLGSVPSRTGKGFPSSFMEVSSLEGRFCKKHRFHVRPGGCYPSAGEQRAASLRPILPVEILDAIFSLLKQHHLHPVLLSNSFLYQVARRKFYHSIVIKTPKNAIAFLNTLLRNPELPPFVRSLELCVAIQTDGKQIANGDIPPPPSAQLASPPIPNPNTPLFTHNFYSLLQRGLQSMISLLSLTLELPKSQSPVWILNDCTFTLRQFTTSMYCNRQLASFLEAQDMIEDLTLRGYQTESFFLLPFLVATGTTVPGQGSSATTDSNTTNATTFTLSPTALSRLKSFNAIHAGPAIIQAIMQGRSVEVASIPLFPERSVPTLNALGSGNTTLKRLSVISFDPGAPEFLLEELAGRFKNLEALHLVLLMADYSNTLFEEYQRILSNFTSLKYLTFMAASGNDSPIDEIKIARGWHRACPTLRTIILPKGSVWFQAEADNGSEDEDSMSNSGDDG